MFNLARPPHQAVPGQDPHREQRVHSVTLETPLRERGQEGRTREVTAREFLQKVGWALKNELEFVRQTRRAREVLWHW